MIRCFYGLLLFFVSIGCAYSQNNECNYITDYYQDVYEAQLYYLQKDYDKAYSILSKLDPNCELLNQQEIYETIIYAELCVREGKHRKAYQLLKHAVINGYPYKSIESNSVIVELLKKRYQEKLKRNAPKLQKEYTKNIDSLLRKEIVAMCQLDQDVRADSDLDKMKIVDAKHSKRLKEIFKEYGYPNEKIIGYPTRYERTNITYVLMHFEDVDYFKPILMEFVKKGQCKPSVLASMVDSQDRKTGLYTYGIYRNVDSSEIKDFENLDKRRLSIGLPTWEMKKKIIELLLEKYKINTQ